MNDRPAHAPLTHHEILGLVEPFARSGRQVDLAASDRLERRLAFKPVPRAAEASALAGLTETLALDHAEPGTFRLTRLLTPASGPAARLQAEGTQLADLLAQIDTVEPARQFLAGDGYVIALSHRLEPTGTLVLTSGELRVGGLTLTLAVPRTPGVPGEIGIASGNDAQSLALPDDLLAVLGWGWPCLRRTRQGWAGSLRLRGSGAQRSQDAEAKLEQAALHLARTLAEPPQRFHERLAAARWGVVFRRAIPLLGCVGLIAAAAAVPRLALAQDSPIRMLIFNAPPLLLVAFFSLREMPRIEIPPWPRRAVATAWVEPAGSSEPR